MRLGMNLLLWTAAAGEEHLPLLDQIKAWGYDGVELPMFAPDCSPWARLAAKMDELGLGRTVVSVVPGDSSLISDDATERRRGIDFLKACYDSTAAVGGTVIAGPMYSPVGKLVGRGPSEDEFKRAVEAYVELGAHATKLGIKVSIESLNRFETYFLNSQGQLNRLVDAVGSPAVGQMYDTFHANIEEKNVAAAIREGGRRINHVHISACDRATPGEDHIDYRTTVATLREIGYDGWLTIESFGSALAELAGATCIWRAMAPSQEHVAREGAKFVRSLM